MNNERCELIARRLRELRQQKGLSHAKLADILSEKYNISISKTSLLSYENTNADDSRVGNRRMNVEFLDCLADFYGVSTDYILGRKDISSNDDSTLTICSSTGLSEYVATRLQQAHYVSDSRAMDSEQYERAILAFGKSLHIPEDTKDYSSICQKRAFEISSFIHSMLIAYEGDVEIQECYGRLTHEVDLFREIEEVIRSMGISYTDIQHYLADHLGSRISSYFLYGPNDIS